MTTEEIIENVLNQIIIPQYPILDGVSVFLVGRNNDFYKIEYYMNEKIKKSEAIEIMNETTDLFNMLSLGGDPDFSVNFEWSKQQ